jgi:hypothetical protein
MKLLRQGRAALLGWCCLLAAAHGQSVPSQENSVGSVSGQFFVSYQPANYPFAAPDFAGDTNIIHLNTELLAVGAERFKLSLWRVLGVASDSTWSGRIALQLHPARSPDETITIGATPFLNRWDYTLLMPDALAKMKYARALSGVLLLELANRQAPGDGHSAEIPPWLVDGMARQVLATGGEEMILSAPSGKPGQSLLEPAGRLYAIPARRLNEARRNFDPLADARQILQATTALTFNELSWPSGDQMSGYDGGVFSASSQLFLASLLDLKNGRAKMLGFLSALPRHLNWQTSFFEVYADDFKSPLDVEKWWALRVVNFAARAPGPRWTLDVSLARLDGLLTVPVEFRYDSNALPAHAEISLQDALQNLPADQRTAVLEGKLRDLELVELRLAPPFGGLADAYRLALADFLGGSKPVVRATVTNKHGVPMNRTTSLAETVKRLNQLDAARRDADAKSVLTLRQGTPPAQ